MEPIVTRLRKLNIELGLVDDKLKINGPKGAITPEVLQQIKENKDYLIDYIRRVRGQKKITVIKPAEKKEYYKLSSAQKRLYVLYEFDRSSTAYNETHVVRLDGELDKTLVQKLFNELAVRHETLRTVFRVKNGEPVQIVTDALQVPVEFFQAAESGVQSIIREFVRAFDLNNGPLIRVGVIEIGNKHHILIVDMHHIITDALSEGVLMSDFLSLYNNRPLPAMSLQYKDYAEWQQGKNRRQEVARQKDFWLKEFAQPVQPLQLPTSFARPRVKGGECERVSFHLGKQETKQLKELAGNEGASPFMLLLSLYNVLLGKLSNQEDIVVGIPMADRQHPALEKVLGIFINTLALRNYPKANISFRQFLNDLRSRALACLDHPAYPYDVLIEDLKIPRDSSRNPLFDVWFIYQSYDKIKFDHSGLSLHEYDQGRRESKFDIVLEAYEAGEQFHFNLSYATDLFTAARIEGFIDCLRELVKGVIANADAKIGEIELFTPVDVTALLPEYTEDRIAPQTMLPASYHQERLWFVDKFESGFLYQAGPVYHTIPLIIDFKGNINATALAGSLRQLVATYSVLRTQIVTVDERPYQKIIGEVPFETAIVDVEQFTEDFIFNPYRLDETLIRSIRLRAGSDSWRLIVTVHHSIADRFSVMYLCRELLQLYGQRLHGNVTSVSNRSLSYAAFTLWQQEHLQERQFHLLAYWKQQLGPKLKALELPMDRPRAAIHIYKSATVDVTLSAEATARLQRLATLYGVDMNALLMGAFTVLLQKYCRHEEIVIGSSAANRAAECWQSLIGPASTLIVIRSFVQPATLFKDHVASIAGIYNAAVRHQAMPFDLLVKELAPEKDMSRTALFDVLFQYEEAMTDLPSIPGVEVSIVETNLGYGKYDLNLLLQHKAGCIDGKLVYNAEYFDHQTVEAFAGHYLQLIENILQTPDAAIAQLEITSEKEKQELLHGSDNLNVPYPVNETVTSLFRKQVQRTPQKIAIKYNNETITYTELDKWSEQLAHVLREQGVLPDQVVGLLTGRSIETVVGMLAILKAGGAYLPIDIDYPEDRINFLVADSGMKLMLTSEEVQHTIPAISISDASIRSKEVTELEEVNKPADCCYVIYTSGTTGRPKGVMVEHGNVVRLFFNDAFQFDFDEHDTWTMFHSHCFDFSVWEIYGALLFGGRVVIVPKAIARDTKAYLELLNDEQVTILNQTPSAFYNLIQEDLVVAGANLHVRTVIFGGEALSPARLKQWHEKYPNVKLVNMFGITETTVHVTYKEIGDHEIRHNISNVGKPIPTLSVFLFDEYMKLVPRGIIGELYVGGAGVSRGYLGNEELTKKKFIVNPYNPAERLYRTGDLARVLHSGDIEYIGRIDHQVQLRGFRIELGEIESQLNNFPGIKESVAIARGNDDDKYLLAYYVSDIAVEAAELRKFLHDKLPDYMVPSIFIRIEKMPLTSNGKLDKQALPDPQVTTDEMHTGPANEIEEKLLEIWAEVLKLDPVVIGVNKSFFELGGHSLRATVLINKISKEFQVSIALKDVFRNQDIISLARYINDARRESFAKVQRAADKEHYPLSSAQQRLFFLNEFDKNSIAYNLPHVVKLKGDVDIKMLNAAFNKLIARHEILRTSFLMIDGRPVQKISAAVDFNIEVIDTISVKPFDISKAPLIRAGITKDQVLVVDMHHIVADGVSQTILVNELAAFYRGESLPEPAIQYKDYAEWQQSGKQKLLIAKQKGFWVEQLSNAPTLELPTDHARPAIKNYTGATMHASVEKQALVKLAKEHDTTLFMVLLAAYNVLLSNLSNQDDVIIGVPVAGRQHADFEYMIGMLVNTIALRNYPKGEISFKEFLSDVKDRALAGFENQAYPYEMLIDDLKVVRDTGRNPLFDVMFMFHNFETAHPEMPGVSISPYDWQPPVSKFDLTLIAREDDEHLQVTIEYSTELFEASTIERFIEYFRNIVSAITTNAEIKLADIDMLPAIEQQLLLQEFNNTYLAYPREATIISLFEEQVHRSPDSIAVISGDQQLSYEALNQQANAIASYIKPGALTGLLLERDQYLLPCILGVLKAGAAYVPIDPSYPADRIKYVLQDSGIELLLTTTSHESLSGIVKMIDVSTIDLSIGNPVNNAEPNATAYMIYTSGSTGRPKGVSITHNNVVNFIYGTRQAVDFSQGNKMLCITTISFDIFVLESLLPLLSGMTIVLAGANDQKDPQSLMQLIKEKQVDFIQMTPSHVKLLLGTEVLQHVKVLMIGGEALPVELVDELQEHYHGKIYNMYGPTETTVWSCIGEIKTSQVTIGKPIANTVVRILDKHGKLVPMGVSGELCIGGEGVSTGYWNRPDLTTEKFIQDRWSSGKLYRTGDLGKWRTDGQLICQGRIDQQVKIRGHRIEPGEIEAQLNNQPSIIRSAVDVKGQGSDKYLVAYYEAASAIDPATLRAQLADVLPGYMIPAYFMQLEKLPLTPNGKLDRKSLPDPQITAGDDYIAPSNAVEERLVELWSEALHIDRSLIGVTKSFFELGGHSLIAMMVNARIQQEFEVKIQLTSFFQKPTISELSKTILVARLAHKQHHTVDKITI